MVASYEDTTIVRIIKLISSQYRHNPWHYSFNFVSVFSKNNYVNSDGYKTASAKSELEL